MRPGTRRSGPSRPWPRCPAPPRTRTRACGRRGRELGRADADDDEPVVRVLLMPGADVSERPEPVDAGVRPEVGEHDLPLQVLLRQRLRVEPPRGPVEARQAALDGQLGRADVTASAEQEYSPT